MTPKEQEKYIELVFAQFQMAMETIFPKKELNYSINVRGEEYESILKSNKHKYLSINQCYGSDRKGKIMNFSINLETEKSVIEFTKSANKQLKQNT
jgi:hypothetical protein